MKIGWRRFGFCLLVGGAPHFAAQSSVSGQIKISVSGSCVKVKARDYKNVARTRTSFDRQPRRQITDSLRSADVSDAKPRFAAGQQRRE